MARAVQGNLCIEAFPPSGLPDQWRCALKSLHSFPKLVVFLLAAGGRALHAQTLNISPNPLNITTQANTGATAQLTFASTGAAITILGYAAGFVVAYVAGYRRQRIDAANDHRYGRSAAGQRHPV